MKNLLKYLYILFSVLVCISCSLEEMTRPDSSRTAQVRFVARPTSFSGYDVVTKSSEALSQIENKISTAFFLAFNNKGERFLFEDLTTGLQGNIPPVTLRSDIRTTEVTICWLANVPYDYASSIRTVADLESKPLDIVYADPNLTGAIGVPALKYKSDSEEEYCFPMFCAKTFDLTTIGTAPVTMELKRLFARMDVELSLNLAGEDDHKNKFFTLVDYSVINLPDKVKLFDQLDTMAVENVKDAVMSPSNWDAADMAQTFTTDRLFDGDATFGQNQGVSFTFYAPEHFVNPVTPTTGLPDDYDSDAEEKKVEKQKYKPLFVGQGQYPTLMRFKGLYVEVEAGAELVKTLTYDIYLGRDNFQDFCIFRNYKYNNKISITATQNFKDGGWMGVDHRVDLETKGFLVSFKRATLLDAHYEVRPMRVRFPISPAAGTVSVEILKEDKTPAGADEMPWIRLERPASSDRDSSSVTHYTNGKRKYFTTDLVSATLKNNVRIEYDPHDDTEGDLEGFVPIWVYVDEYAVAADDNAENKNRKAIIRVTFTPDEITENSGVVSQSFIVQQRAMYPISYDSRTYNIEYFEEYLYNFDGEKNYGEEGGEYVGENGIIWGMKGKQLSQLYQSMFMNSAASGGWEGLIETFMNMTLSSISPKYDYYLSRDLPESVYDYRDNVPVKFSESEYEAVKYRDYAGYTFNLETILNNNINNGNNLLLNYQPSSALEYCYKKNKAGSGQKDAIYVESTSGSTTTYNTANFKWYLPAIDEMEDIIMGGKDVEFFNDIFTKSLYWSCQTSFNRNYLYYNTMVGSTERRRIGEYYEEDVRNARATKLEGDTFLTSGSRDYSGLYYMYYYSIIISTPDPVVVKDTTDPLELYYHVYERRQTGTEETWWGGSRPIYETKWWQEEKIHTFAYEVDDPGVRPRDEFNRVRCIYNPTPPKQIKKTVSNGNTTYELVY